MGEIIPFPDKPAPDVDDTADDNGLETRAGLDVLRERFRLASGGKPPIESGGLRADLVHTTACMILQIEAIDRREAARGRDG